MKVTMAALMALALAGGPVEGDLLIRDVTIIDPQSGVVSPAQDVLLTNGRIHLVAPHASRDLAAGRTIEASGHFLIPGLNDMHSHSSFVPVHNHSLKLMHANGVTAVREMGSDCVEPGGMGMCLADMQVSRRAIADGEMIGPRLMMLSSAKIHMERGEDASGGQILYRPIDAESAAATVAGLKARGAEILKTSENWSPEGFAAFMEAANAADVDVGGHIPIAFSVAEVSAMGMKSIEHARDLPMDCSKVGAEMRDHMKRKLSGEDLPFPDRRTIPGRSVAEFDEALCAVQIAAMVEHDVYYVPTHPTREMDYRAGEDEYRGDPRMAYIPAMQQRFWKQDLDRTASAPPQMVADLAAFYQLGLRTTKMAHDAGVKVMVGTDANDTMIFPGFSVHDEIANLVEAGLTPMQALAAATSVPADYFGLSDHYGGVSEGKVADLVLLSADPLSDIANTIRIEAVIQGGRLSDRAALDALLDEARAFAAQAGPIDDD